MRTENIGFIATLRVRSYGLKGACRGLGITIHCDPGPFPQGPPPSLSTVQYIGISKHLILTLAPTKWVSGLLPFQADVPYDKDFVRILWVGLVSVSASRTNRKDFQYMIPEDFIRDVDDILPYGRELRVAGTLIGLDGVVSGRQYWLLEIPALTREVLMRIDEIVVLRKSGMKKTGAKSLVIRSFQDRKRKGRGSG